MIGREESRALNFLPAYKDRHLVVVIFPLMLTTHIGTTIALKRETRAAFYRSSHDVGNLME
jgi:hypothetical protein